MSDGAVIGRRGLLLAALAAPAIVRVGSLMPVRVWDPYVISAAGCVGDQALSITNIETGYRMFYTQAALDKHGASDMRPMIRIQEELLAKWQMYRGPITVVAVV